MPTTPSAQVIADSISPSGHRLTTMEVTCHRFVLAEFNTHRVFSRNSASSRAIPVRKQLEKVLTDPALPLAWPCEQSGMQGGESLNEEEVQRAQDIWLQARDNAYWSVAALTNALRKPEDGLLLHPLHKSVANRLLEPFMWHKIVVTSTEWDNFFGLRCSPLAQPEIQAVAYSMQAALEVSVPVELLAGEWHLPYVQDDEIESNHRDSFALRNISAARCARVSTLTQDGIRDPQKDMDLFYRLTSADPQHASPLEHVATPCVCATNENSYAEGHLGNFTGWDQLRHWDYQRELELRERLANPLKQV